MTNQATKRAPIPIAGLAHIGIRVHDLERSVRFYELLGFTKTAGPLGPEPVAILEHPSGVEVNLVLNAPNPDEPNVLMDVPAKHPGITHFALLCADRNGRDLSETGGFGFCTPQYLKGLRALPMSFGIFRIDQRMLLVAIEDPRWQLLGIGTRVKVSVKQSTRTR
jgi:catechol 2,3-dioxygenase-like lactoylglutathione lyase family enzyme